MRSMSLGRGSGSAAARRSRVGRHFATTTDSASRTLVSLLTAQGGLSWQPLKRCDRVSRPPTADIADHLYLVAHNNPFAAKLTRLNRKCYVAMVIKNPREPTSSPATTHALTRA